MLDAKPGSAADVLESGPLLDLSSDVVTTATVTEPRRHWAARASLRFACVYFGLYVALTQMLPTLMVLPVGNFPFLGQMRPVTASVEWVASNVFGAPLPLVLRSGSGDKTFDWVLAFMMLVTAVVAAIIWTVAGRAGNDLRLHQWFRVLTRFALGATMISYGVAKAIPMQMPYPSLNRLLERYGDFSPMGVLWASIGASPAYEIFTGCAEMLAGILLFVPQTAMLGAITAFVVSIEIFTLNMTYDVPVKLFSFHLILMALALLAPDARRLANVLVFNRMAGPSIIPALGRTKRSMRIAVATQLALGAYIVGMNVYSTTQSWTQFGGGAPKSPLYGIWNIEYMAINGVERAPLLTDYERWRRITFDRPTSVSFHRMDDSVLTYTAAIDQAARSITLTKPADKAWTAALTYDRSAEDQLTVSGEIDGRTLAMRLKLFERNRFLLVNRGFHWVQEFPFNR